MARVRKAIGFAAETPGAALETFSGEDPETTDVTQLTASEIWERLAPATRSQIETISADAGLSPVTWLERNLDTPQPKKNLAVELRWPLLFPTGAHYVTAIQPPVNVSYGGSIREEFLAIEAGKVTLRGETAPFWDKAPAQEFELTLDFKDFRNGVYTHTFVPLIIDPTPVKIEGDVHVTQDPKTITVKRDPKTKLIESAEVA